MILNNGAGGMVEIVDGNGVVIGRGELEDEARWMAERVLRERGVANAAEVAAALPVKGALTADDLSDIGLENLHYVAKNTFSDWRMLPRASELEGNGAELLNLGLIEERVPEKYGVAGSARVGVTDAGLDLLASIKAA